MNNNIVVIIDTGLGNIHSVVRMIEYLGARAHICSKPENHLYKHKIILPGVGRFDYGITSLYKHGFDNTFWHTCIKEGSSILGICLGMQMLCRSSEEGIEPGLGLVGAEVKKFHFTSEQNLKVPHMGWNLVHTTRDNNLIPFSDEEKRFYFVHSYIVVPDNPNIIIGSTHYGGEFCAAFQSNNIFGVQFHPEKSHRFGMKLIKRFIEL